LLLLLLLLPPVCRHLFTAAAKQNEVPALERASCKIGDFAQSVVMLATCKTCLHLCFRMLVVVEHPAFCSLKD
jgi:hypothetical protein